MSTKHSFWIPCNPPKGTYQSGKTLLKRADGKMFIGRSKSGRVLRDTLYSLFVEHVPPAPLDGPLSLSIKYAYPFRKTEKKAFIKRGWRWNDKRPDADNLAKQVQDVMGRLNFFRDDGEIARLTVEKIWSDSPGIGVRIEQLEQE